LEIFYVCLKLIPIAKEKKTKKKIKKHLLIPTLNLGPPPPHNV
jgi:hypothetical protein